VIAPPGSDMERFLAEEWPKALAAAKRANIRPPVEPAPLAVAPGRCRDCGEGERVAATALCEGCYRQALTRVGDELAGRVTTPTKPPPEPQRLPREVRARRLADHVRTHGWITMGQAADAAGLGSVTGSLPKVIVLAREHGWVETKSGPGGGVGPGAVAPA